MIRRLLPLLLLVAVAFGSSGYSNGDLPSSALAPIRANGGGVVYLARDGAAAAWNTMRLCSNRQGVDLYTGGYGAYRPYSAQQYYWNLYQRGQGNLAAYPGTSNHGLGHAVDNDLVRMVTWINAHGGAFGWSWGEAPSEWWHVTYYGHFHGNDPGPDVANPRLAHGSGGACQQYAVDEARQHLGLTTGRPFTSNMVVAVKSFQFAHRISRTGVIDGRTWSALRGTVRAVKNPSILRNGNTGQDVAAVQGLINARLKDVRNPHLLHVDGVYGPATSARLRYLQKYWWRIPVTGLTTTTTRKLLKVTLVRKPPAKPNTGAENTKPPPTKAVPHPKVVHRGPMYGADLSEHNGSVNFAALRRRVEFVILRATWTGNTTGGLHRDAQLSSSNCQQARSAGLKLGLYAYDIAGKGGSPEHAADFYTSTVWNSGACRWRPGDLLPAHDMEEGPGARAAWSGRWRARVEHNLRAGLRHVYGHVIEYGGNYVQSANPSDPGLQSPLWLPAYGNNDGTGVPDYWLERFTPPAWRAHGWWYAIYQYQSNGRVAGVPGDVDFNVLRQPDYWLPKLLVK